MPNVTLAKQIQDAIQEELGKAASNGFVCRVTPRIMSRITPLLDAPVPAGTGEEGEVKIDWPTEPGLWDRCGEIFQARQVGDEIVVEQFAKHGSYSKPFSIFRGGWRRVPYSSEEERLKAEIEHLTQRRKHWQEAEEARTQDCIRANQTNDELRARIAALEGERDQEKQFGESALNTAKSLRVDLDEARAELAAERELWAKLLDIVSLQKRVSMLEWRFNACVVPPKSPEPSP
jgi:hypothetical protein